MTSSSNFKALELKLTCRILINTIIFNWFMGLAVNIGRCATLTCFIYSCSSKTN